MIFKLTIWNAWSLSYSERKTVLGNWISSTEGGSSAKNKLLSNRSSFQYRGLILKANYCTWSMFSNILVSSGGYLSTPLLFLASLFSLLARSRPCPDNTSNACWRGVALRWGVGSGLLKTNGSKTSSVWSHLSASCQFQFGSRRSFLYLGSWTDRFSSNVCQQLNVGGASWLVLPWFQSHSLVTLIDCLWVPALSLTLPISYNN